MTEFQPSAPGDHDQNRPTIADILGPEDSGDRQLGGAVISNFYGTDTPQVSIPMPAEEAQELARVASIANRSISDIVRVALQDFIPQVQAAHDWPEKVAAYTERTQPLLPPADSREATEGKADS